ncbi:MAG TPA: glycosyltransferase [Bacteroidales bacterium]|mgnify:CR=1 FL=1|nr:glycosyltransferase [Bacteroidales bacterium]HPS51440.1 glycosyltransferase [Bacteroidales bacterium]
MNKKDCELFNVSQKLEIIIITFNRSIYLRKTLNQLFSSPFADCKITVLNNCSTDNTILTVNEFSSVFSRLKLVTNKINIGGNANIIRAIELSESVYTWVLCDDDNFDFSFCDDIIEAIELEKYDLIHVGAHEESWDFGGVYSKIKELVRNGYPFFKYCSFVPCNLFRTELFNKSIIQAYDNVYNWYPHMPFLIDYYNNNGFLYISKRRIVTASVGTQPYSLDKLAHKWINNTVFLKTKSDKLIFALNQYYEIEEIHKFSINKLLLLYAIFLLRKGKYSLYFKMYHFANLYQYFILFFSIFLLPVWYIKNSGRQIK